MAKGRNLTYWEKREIQRYKQLEKFQKKETDYTLRLYRAESDRINKEIFSLYAKYAEDNALSLTEAKKVLNATDTEKFHRKMRAYKEQLKDSKNPDSIIAKMSAMEKRARIKRIDAINMEIESRMALLGSRQIPHYKNYKFRMAKTSYKSTKEMLKERFNLKPTLDALTKNSLEVMVNYPYKGVYFSDSIWGSTSYVAERSKQLVLNGIMTGQHVRTTAKELDKVMGRGYSNAERLIRTETNLIINQANKIGFEKTGIKQYEYAAVMDERTSTICIELDGQIFPLDEGVPGVNMPPLHPSCRSIIMPLFDEDDE